MGIWGRSGGEGLELYPCLLPNFFDLDEVTEHFTQRPLATWLGGVMECGRSAWKSLRQKLPPSCLCHLSYLLIFSPFFSPFFSPLLFPSHLHTHICTHTHTTHTRTPKLMPHVMSDFLLPKGCLLFRHLSWWGPSEENPFVIPLMGNGVHRTSL